MKKISTMIILIACCIVNPLISQELASPKIKQEKVPEEVQKFIDETMSGQHAMCNFEESKVSFGFDRSTKLSDLKAGRPFKIYKLSIDSLLKKGENMPISSNIIEYATWVVPVLLNGKCITTFEVIKTKKNPLWHQGVFYGCSDTWQKLMEAWSESAGYHPVIIYATAWEMFFHIPEKDDYNLTPFFPHQYNSLQKSLATTEKSIDSSENSLASPQTNFARSYKNVLHSKITLRYIKENLPAKLKGEMK